MIPEIKDKKPNQRLRYERELRGWTQHQVAMQLGADQNIVSRWECGERSPGPYYRQKLCALFEKSAAELGFIDQEGEDELASRPPEERSEGNQVESTNPDSRQAIQIFIPPHISQSSSSIHITISRAPVSTQPLERPSEKGTVSLIENEQKQNGVYWHQSAPDEEPSSSEEEKTTQLIALTEEEFAALSALVDLRGESMVYFDAAKRETLRKLLALASIAVVAPVPALDTEPWERLAAALSKPSTLDQHSLAHFHRKRAEDTHPVHGIGRKPPLLSFSIPVFAGLKKNQSV